jgi:3-hydroxyacyl-CoA dehydrogenase/enoyl-CoA hydratase/3-hydroxybutyryl-CoA epimerase
MAVMENFKIETDADGIALITFDAPGKSMNTLTIRALEEIGTLVEQIRSDAAIKGVVIASGKASGFCAGADLDEMIAGFSGGGDEGSLKALYGRVATFNRTFRALETCGKPVAVALEGLALGGGLELALACHYRVAADNPKLQLGLPESKVGLIPGGGGTQRLPRLIGAMAAAPLLLEGKSLRASEALGLKVVHEVVAPGGCIDACKAWIKGGGKGVAPWDEKDFKIPGGLVYSAQGIQVFIMGNAMVRKSTYGNYPAQLNIMKAVYEGLQVPMDAALRIESRYFAQTCRTPQATAMIRTLFQSLQALNKGSARPADAAATEIRKAAVLGAGMMGAGIAHAQALAGIETVLIDQTQEAADKGRAHVEDLIRKAVSRGRLSADKGEAALALVTATTDYALIKGADLVVEAVFENRELKADVTRRAEAQLAPGAIFGSNTSTLPITGLAQASVRPDAFIGIHFFSPVDRMSLVEIIRGDKTSDQTVAAAIDYVMKLKKTPIVVNDGRGFYTSRCFSTYVAEGLEMLAEGIAPAIIDNIGRATGMPRGPLEMADDVALDLVHKITVQTKADLGDAYRERPTDAIIERMVVREGRLGRKNGKGFYDYPSSGDKTLWPGIGDIVAPAVTQAEPDIAAHLRTRLLYRQAVEAARCFEEGVVTDARDADVGAIFGWGFAPWSGGPMSLIDGVGAAAFVAACDDLAKRYGERFEPPAGLRAMAARGEGYYGPAAAKAA